MQVALSPMETCPCLQTRRSDSHSGAGRQHPERGEGCRTTQKDYVNKRLTVGNEAQGKGDREVGVGQGGPPVSHRQLAQGDQGRDQRSAEAQVSPGQDVD